LKKEYIKLCYSPSDIYEHLPTLAKYANECESVLELGVRDCISSWAFAYGLLNNTNTNNNNKKLLFLNDIEICDIKKLLHYTNNTNLLI